MSESSKSESLRQRPLFTSLSDEQWEKLQPLMHHESHAPQANILQASNQTKDLYWIESGTVEVKRETPFGEQQLATLKEDDAFGEIALIDGMGHSADVWASSQAHVWRLEGDALEALFQEDHPLACHFYRYFWRTLAEKIHLANQQLTRFFAQDSTPSEPEAPVESPSRPAWFAPPEGEGGSSSSELSGAPQLQISREEKHEALAKRGLSRAEIDVLLQRGEELYIPTDEAVFHEGDFGDTLYFVLHGRVLISKAIEGLGEEALAILDPGEIFGEMALVAENARRSANCSAHENPVLLLAFRLHVLNAMQGTVETDYSFLQALCKMMSHRLREINEKLVSWKMFRGGFF